MVNVMTNDLAELMKNWLDKVGHRNRESLRRLTGVSYSTLTRIIQKECNASLDVVLAIVTSILDKNDLLEFLKNHLPEIFDVFKGFGSPESDASREINEALRSRDGFIILTMAATVGTTREAIQLRLGGLGLDRLDELIDLHIVEEVQGVIRSKQREFLVLNPDTLLAEIKLMAEIFDKDRIGQVGAMAYVETASVDTAALEEIHMIYREAQAKVTRIARQSQGPHVVYAGLILNTLNGETK